MKHLITFFVILFPLNLLAGFSKDTLVQSSLDLIPISAIEKDNLVESMHNNAHEHHPIIALWSVINKEVVLVVLPDNEIVVTSRDQKFYLPLEQAWRPANLLKPQDFLLTINDVYIPIKEVRCEQIEERLYDISVRESNNYYVTRHKILVHNVVPIAIGVSFLIGSGSIEFAGFSLALGCTVFGGWIGAKLWGRTSHHEANIIPKYKDKYNTQCFGDTLSVGEYNIEIYTSLSGQDLNSVYALSEKKNEEQLTTTDQNHDAERLKKAGAPGKPTEKDGFVPAKNGNGEKVKHKRGYGWADKKGSIWIPTGPAGAPNAHRGPHWDVQHTDGTYDNIGPDGKILGKK